MWAKTPPAGTYTWKDALIYANDQNASSLCGYNDGWRLPNILELESLVNLERPGSAMWLNRPENGFVGITANLYWSSTTSASEIDRAWLIDFNDDRRDVAEKGLARFVLPVRGVTSPPAQLWTSGQTTSYENGDDGDLTTGVVWPSPRFEETVNGVVRDNLTGLMWTRDAGTPGPQPCNHGGVKFSYDAYPFIQCLNQNNYLGHSDWRLPNRKELTSLIDHSRSNPALPSGHPFTGIGSTAYWSSDTYAALSSSGWTVDVYTGQTGIASKASDAFLVWPVRGPLSLKVLLTGDGAGAVTGDGISCSGNTCAGIYYNGETITVTANSPTNSVFIGWTGCPAQSGSECVVVMGTDITITASFLNAKSIWDKPSSLNLGKVGVNVLSSPKYVSVKNIYGTSLQVDTVSVSGENEGEFLLDENCSGITLPTGETCTIALSVNAQSYGKRSAELSVAFNDTKVQTVKIKLTAKALPAKIYVKPKTLSFGKVVVSGSASQLLTIENTGHTPLSISSIVPGGEHEGDLTVDPINCGVLQGGQSCAVKVTFAPGGVGRRTGALVIQSDAPKRGVVNVKLKGEGTQPGT